MRIIYYSVFSIELQNSDHLRNVTGTGKERTEELDMMLEENRCKVEEAQRKGALEQQQKELERYLEPERIQKQREEALRQKKIEEEIANQLRLLGTYW
jgi:arginine and glutamate-rich protein 1